MTTVTVTAWQDSNSLIQKQDVFSDLYDKSMCKLNPGGDDNISECNFSWPLTDDYGPLQKTEGPVSKHTLKRTTQATVNTTAKGELTPAKTEWQMVETSHNNAFQQCYLKPARNTVIDSSLTKF